MNTPRKPRDNSIEDVPPSAFENVDEGSHTEETPVEESGRTFDDGKGRIFPCENCGGDLEFHIGQQSLKCPWCGHVKEIVIEPTLYSSSRTFATCWSESGNSANKRSDPDRRNSKPEQNPIAGRFAANPAVVMLNSSER